MPGAFASGIHRGLGARATNKQRRVYTGALLATTVSGSGLCLSSIKKN